ncbi:MAG: hypothetical protein ACJ790_22980 [Myxococcaceae bacterium]
MTVEDRLKYRLLAMAVGLLVCLGVVLFKAVTMNNSPSVVVLAPVNGKGVKVSVSGDPAITIAAGEYKVIDVSKGKHTVEIEDVATGKKQVTEVQVMRNGENYVVPVNASQCLVVCDVGQSHYGDPYEKNPPSPKCTTRHHGTDAFLAPDDSYFSMKSLPTTTDKYSVNVTVEADCAFMGYSDSELAHAMQL